MAHISAISYYLPARILSNEELSNKFPEWNVEKISSKTGISQRHIAAPDEFSSDMAVTVAEKLFQEHNIDRTSIDFLILCTQSPDYFLPTTACIIQERLGLATKVGALDFNLGCSGFVYGLALAKGLVAGQMARNVLLITSETYSKFIHPRDKSNLTIFGDAAAATLVSAAPGICSLGDFVFGTDGKGASNLIVREGGLRSRGADSGSPDRIDEFGNLTNDGCLYMNGPEIFNFTSESVPALMQEVLRRNNVGPEAIDLYVLHQANKQMLTHLRKKMNIPEEKFFIGMQDCGNTVSSTIPIALADAMKQGKIPGKAKVAIAGFGVGYSWSGCILNF